MYVSHHSTSCPYDGFAAVADADDADELALRAERNGTRWSAAARRRRRTAMAGRKEMGGLKARQEMEKRNKCKGKKMRNTEKEKNEAERSKRLIER